MPADEVIPTRDLSKHFGAVRALDALDLEVHRGEVFGFLGPDGAGKTTTIRLLLDFLRYAAVVVLVPALTGVALVALLAMAQGSGLLDGVRLGRIAGASAALVALTVLHASLTFATGCPFGRRGIASAVAGAVAVAGYLLVGLTAAAGSLEPLRWLSPWHWYLDRNLLVDAPGPAAIVLPLGPGLALAAAGGWRLVHRDLRLP